MSVFIIAEAGVNHNGDLILAKKLIDVAVEAGADAVKFQSFKAALIASKVATKAAYQKQTTDTCESQREMLEKLELTETMHYELWQYCKDRHIQFLSTPFDFESIQLLFDMGMRIFKIPSGEITNLPHLRAVARIADEIILSTGMATEEEVDKALNVLLAEGVLRQNITVLHATSEYPCPFDEVNLNAMLTMKQKFSVNVGYSDHTSGIAIALAAVALGAQVIEKHFTLDQNMIGPDHKASLEPKDLVAMVKAIRNIECSMGDGIKKPTKSELLNINDGRKSIVAKCAIKKGEILSADLLTVKRPGSGISPMFWDQIIGTRAIKDFEPDDLIEINREIFDGSDKYFENATCC